jgi:glucose-1-phosphate thymidylyltransferase
MKGIVLAGGRATRLRPLTLVTSKQLLPVFDKPMIYYPIETLVRAGIEDILVIVAPDYSGHFLNLLGDGKQFGAKISFMVQKEPRGLAEAFIIGEDFIDDGDVTMILGDNIFDHDFSESIRSFKGGGRVFAKKVDENPQRFGVVEFDENQKVLSIEEKPTQPKSDYAVVGIYVYDNRCIQYAKELKPSPPPRNEIEITDINNRYLQDGELDVQIIEGMWEDAGTLESLHRVSHVMYERWKAEQPAG